MPKSRNWQMPKLKKFKKKSEKIQKKSEKSQEVQLKSFKLKKERKYLFTDNLLLPETKAH